MNRVVTTTKTTKLLLWQMKMMRMSGQRYFSSSSTTTTSRALIHGSPKIICPNNHYGGGGGSGWSRFSMADQNQMVIQRNLMSSSSSASKEEEDKGEDSNKKKKEEGIVSYWGVSPPQLTKPDGTPWKWPCFRPWETYKPDVSIDVEKHHKPSNLTDRIAYWTVELLKFNTRLFFQKRHMCHAMLLETVAAVPGMVGGMLLHCKSLRRFEHSGGWIKLLLDEAENERMHLMTFIEIAKPQWFERALVFIIQGLFFNAYFVAYVVSPRLAHRICGYLEEEAVHSYTEFLKDLDKGLVENVPAPAIAIDYWRLPPDSTLRDVVTVIRADEAHHRDINHFASDIHSQGHELKDYPAPLDYH